MPSARGIVAAAFDVPVTPDGDQARQWAVNELNKQVYQEAKPGLLSQLWNAVVDWLRSVLDSLNGISPNLGLVVIIAVVVVVIGVAIWLVRPRLNRRRTAAAAVFDKEPVATAELFREAAARAAAGGRWQQAVTDSFRAVVRQAEERFAIDPVPGRTAEEIAASLRQIFPGFDRSLISAAALFDGVHYGQADATEADFAWMRDLDAQLRAAHPTYRSGESAHSGMAVPR